MPFDFISLKECNEYYYNDGYYFIYSNGELIEHYNYYDLSDGYFIEIIYIPYNININNKEFSYDYFVKLHDGLVSLRIDKE